LNDEIKKKLKIILKRSKLTSVYFQNHDRANETETNHIEGKPKNNEAKLSIKK
jgi:hypothetical protein